MQFNFNVNEILKSEFIILDNKSKLGYVPFGTNMNSIKIMDDGQKLSFIIDEMGKASALAQGLPGPITSSSKLKHSDHRLYLLKTDDGNNGDVVGFLKVGYKTLFVYDIQSHQNELKPLCVLDFYVHESKQRQGYGRVLFDWMLQTENVQSHHIAIDRPSSKFLLFLAKHYQLTDKIPQQNNFVVFVNFFNSRLDTNSNNQRRYRQSIQTPTTVVTPSPPSPTKQPYTSINSSNIVSAQHTKRRSQSSANKDRAPLTINDLHSLTKIDNVTDSDVNGPPMLPRDGVPPSYRALLTPVQRLASADNINQGKMHCLPRIGARSPDKMYNGHSVVTLAPVKGQLCGRSRRDYNYSVGLARNYSHTRLW